MREISPVKIWTVCKKEYLRWLFNPKWFMIFLLVIPIRECVLLPLIQVSKQSGELINVLEPCIGMVNSGLVVFLLPLGYLVLMMEFPGIDANMSWYIYRIGRKNWILGEMLFQVLSAVSYLAFFSVICIVHVWNIGFWGNGWSFVVTGAGGTYTAEERFIIGNIVPLNLFYQMPPYKAFILSYALLFLSLLVWSSMMSVAALYAKRVYAIAGIVVSLVLGMGLGGSQLKWFFLLEHSVLSMHFQKYFRDYVFSPYYSLAVFLALLIVFCIWLYVRAGRVSMDILWEENTDD